MLYLLCILIDDNVFEYCHLPYLIGCLIYFELALINQNEYVSWVR